MIKGYSRYQNAIAEKSNPILIKELLINKCNTCKKLELLIIESIDSYSND